MLYTVWPDKYSIMLAISLIVWLFDHHSIHINHLCWHNHHFISLWRLLISPKKAGHFESNHSWEIDHFDTQFIVQTFETLCIHCIYRAPYHLLCNSTISSNLAWYHIIASISSNNHVATSVRLHQISIVRLSGRECCTLDSCHRDVGCLLSSRTYPLPTHSIIQEPSSINPIIISSLIWYTFKLSSKLANQQPFNSFSRDRRVSSSDISILLKHHQARFQSINQLVMSNRYQVHQKSSNQLSQPLHQAIKLSTNHCYSVSPLNHFIPTWS